MKKFTKVTAAALAATLSLSLAAQRHIIASPIWASARSVAIYYAVKLWG